MSIDIGGVEVFSLEEVSKRLNVTPEALKRCMRRGELAARKIGDQWFITTQNLLAFLQTPTTSRRTQKHLRLPEEVPGPESRIAPPTEPLAAIALEKLVREHASTPPAVAPAPAPPAAPQPPGEQSISQRPTEAVIMSVSEPPAPPSELATEITMPSIPFPPKEEAKSRPAPEAVAVPEPVTLPELSGQKPPARDGERPGEALAALFEMPLLPPETPVLTALEPAPVDQGPQTPPPGDTKDDRHAIAVAATQRRAMSKAGVLEAPPPVAPAPGQTSRRSLLDSDEMPVPAIDAPGASHAPDTRPVVAAIAPPPPPVPGGAGLSEIPNMFGPDSPTVLLTPEQVAADSERVKKALLDTVEQGRVAQRARDEIVGTVKKLPLEEQSFALSGPIGEQLVKLDKLIEDGVRAQRELGLAAAPAGASVITAIHKAPPTPGGPPLQQKQPPSGATTEARRPEDSRWVPAGAPVAPDPVPLIQAAAEKVKAPSRVAPAGVGGETWHEVGLPAPAGSSAPGSHVGPVVRLTLALSDEEKRMLADHRIAEEVAVQEIMRRYQPTDERGWEDAKGRYFQPLRNR